MQPEYPRICCGPKISKPAIVTINFYCAVLIHALEHHTTDVLACEILVSRFFSD